MSKNEYSPDYDVVLPYGETCMLVGKLVSNEKEKTLLLEAFENYAFSISKKGYKFNEAEIFMSIRSLLCNGTTDCENGPECPEGTDGCVVQDIIALLEEAHT